MCIDRATDMKETLNTMLGYNSDADIDLGYEKNFYELRNCDNENLYIPIVPTSIEESAIPIIVDEDAVDHIPKNSPPCGRSHVCAHGTAAHTYSCTEWCSSYLRWKSWEKEK